MNSNAIETLAIGAVRESIVTTEILGQYIADNDKEPSWDGFIYVYKDKNHRKDNLRGRVPVQVKGELNANQALSQISYAVEIADLLNYKTDGGVIFFVVYINHENPNQKKIYYASLTPVKIISYIKDAESQKTKTIKLKEFPYNSHICKYYNIEYIEQFLPNIKEQEIDYRTAFRCLIRSFVLDMSFKDTEWIKLNREFVKDILRIMKNFRDFTDTLKLSGIYVNQNDIFCLPTDLKIESNIPEDLKAIYSVVKKKDVKNILVAEDFQMFWDFQEKDKLQGGTLANELEEVFFEEDISKINSHTYRETILNIINKITENTDNGLWSILFKDIENNKEVIMMATITDGERKNSMFKILTANEATLNTLASLTNEDDIDKILALGRQAYKKEQEDREEWEFKKSIGVHLENKINEELTQRLSSQNGTIKCISEQGGQDIIVNHNNNPIYFIEIKGRWSSRESVLMSKVQIDKAKENLDKYSICCINLFDYVDKEDSQKRFYPEMDIIEDRLKALNNIGSKVELLIPSKEDITETTVTLGGDYKAIVPQALFDGEGISFDQLIDIIIKDIK